MSTINSDVNQSQVATTIDAATCEDRRDKQYYENRYLEQRVDWWLKNSPPALLTVKRLGTLQKLEQAINENDGSLFQIVLLHLPKLELEQLRKNKSFSDFLHDFICKQIHVYTSTTESVRILDSDGELVEQQRHPIEVLQNAAKFAEAALIAGIEYESDKRNPDSIIKLAKYLTIARKGDAVAIILERAIMLNYQIPEVVILSALAVTGRQLRGSRDLKNYAALATCALNKGLIDPYSRRAASVYDVVLALIGSPFNIRERGGYPNFLGEHDIIDIASRMRLAMELGMAVIQSGLVFDSPRHKERINLLARGSLRVAAGLYCAAAEIKYKDNKSFLKQIRSQFNISSEYYSVSRPGKDLFFPELFEQSESLATDALYLAYSSIVGSTNTNFCHTIRASTINNIFRLYASTKIMPNEHDISVIAALAGQISASPNIVGQLYSYDISRLVEYIASLTEEQKLVDEYLHTDIKNACVQLVVTSLNGSIIPGNKALSIAEEYAYELWQQTENDFNVILDRGGVTFRQLTRLVGNVNQTVQDHALIDRHLHVPSLKNGTQNLILGGGLNGGRENRRISWQSFKDMYKALLEAKDSAQV